MPRLSDKLGLGDERRKFDDGWNWALHHPKQFAKAVGNDFIAKSDRDAGHGRVADGKTLFNGWDAVARRLVVRGVLDEDRSLADDDVLHAVLAIVLFADSSLMLSFAHAPGEGDDRHELLWLKGDLVIRHTTLLDGIHHFSGGERESLDEVLAGMLGDPPAAVARGATSQVLAGRRFVQAESRRTVGENRFEGDSLTLVESPRRGLWLARAQPAGDGVVVAHVDAETATEQIRVLA